MGRVPVGEDKKKKKWEKTFWFSFYYNTKGKEKHKLHHVCVYLQFQGGNKRWQNQTAQAVFFRINALLKKPQKIHTASWL